MKRHDPTHSAILVGDPGLGKTTLARIFCDEIMEQRSELYKGRSLGALISTTGKQYKEYDCSVEASYNSLIKFIAESRCQMNPHVCYADEAHRLTEKQQTAFLKPVEDREDLYLIFSTTKIDKILDTLRLRSAIYTVSRPSMRILKKEVGRVAREEGLNLLPDALEYLITISDYVPRDCINNLGELFVYGKKPITKKMVQDALESKNGPWHLPMQ